MLFYPLMPLVVVVLTGIYVEIAGQDKPVGDNARKGAVKKRSQVKTSVAQPPGPNVIRRAESSWQ